MDNRWKFAITKPNKSGWSKIRLHAYLDRETRPRIDTGCKIRAVEWDERRGMPSVQTRYGQQTAVILTDMVHRIEDHELKLIGRGSRLTVLQLKAAISGTRPTEGGTLIDYMESELLADTRLIPETKRSHKQTINKLHDFAPDAKLSEVDHDFLKRFDRYLHALASTKSDDTLHHNTIEGHHRRLRRYLYLAERSGLIHKNPYKDFKLNKVPSNKQALLKEEIDRILAVDYSCNPRLDNVRTLFVFSCYTGLRYNELKNLRMKDCNLTGRGWEIVLHQIRKYPTPVFLPLWALFDGEPNKLFTERFVASDGLKISVSANQKLNVDLKIIARDAGVTKPLSWHIARHTFATMIGAVCGDFLLVKDLLGHRDVKTSMIYCKQSPEIIRQKLTRVVWSTSSQ